MTPSDPEPKQALDVGQDTAVIGSTCIDPGTVFVTDVELIEMPADHELPFHVNAAPLAPASYPHEYIPVATHEAVDSHDRPVIDRHCPGDTAVDQVPLDSSRTVP